MILTGIGTGVGALISFFSSFKWVKEGELGVLTTFGKASRNNDGTVKLVQKGFKFIIPFIQTLDKVHTQKNTSLYSGLGVTLKNGISYSFNAFIVYHIKPTEFAIENVLFKLEDYEQYVSLMYEKVIQDVLQEVDQLDSKKFNQEIKDLLKPILSKEGIQLDDCGLVSFTATEVSQQLLGINYKLQLASTSNLPNNILAAAIGATPTVSVEKSIEVPVKETEE